MEGKTVLITGATDGIGKQVAMAIASQGARVLVHGRTPLKSENASREIKSVTGSDEVVPIVADFSSLHEVRQLVDTISDEHPKIHVLINNAGVYMNERRLSADGYEMTFAVNHLAHFLLSHLLLDTLKRSAPSRIINVSSVAHQRGTLRLDDLHGDRRFDPYGAYAQSKLANILFTKALARRLDGTGVTVNALHPGVIGTKLLYAGFSMKGASLQKGAETPVFLASSPDVEGVTGEYFVDCAQQRPAAHALDESAQEQLWDESMRLVGFVPERQKP